MSRISLLKMWFTKYVESITIATFMKLLAIKIVARRVFGFSRSFKILFDTEEFSSNKFSFWELVRPKRATSEPESKAEIPTIKSITSKIIPICKLKGKKIELLFAIRR